MSPLLGTQKPLQTLAISDALESPVENALKIKHDFHNCDNDLLAVADAWPTLPEALRAGIVAMVKAAGHGGRKE